MVQGGRDMRSMIGRGAPAILLPALVIVLLLGAMIAFPLQRCCMPVSQEFGPGARDLPGIAPLLLRGNYSTGRGPVNQTMFYESFENVSASNWTFQTWGNVPHAISTSDHHDGASSLSFGPSIYPGSAFESYRVECNLTSSLPMPDATYDISYYRHEPHDWGGELVIYVNGIEIHRDKGIESNSMNDSGWYRKNVTYTGPINVFMIKETDLTLAETVFLDDLRIVRLIPDQPPVAAIVSIVPEVARPGEHVVFTGNGTDADGVITGCIWNSSMDGNLSTELVFNTTGLSVGNHTIGFRVQDDDGSWSGTATGWIVVENATSSDGAGNGNGNLVYLVLVSSLLLLLVIIVLLALRLRTVRQPTADARCPICNHPATTQMRTCDCRRTFHVSCTENMTSCPDCGKKWPSDWHGSSSPPARTMAPPVIDLAASERTSGDAVKCNVCFGHVKPGVPFVKCNCGKNFHTVCARRVGTCPSCNGVFR